MKLFDEDKFNETYRSVARPDIYGLIGEGAEWQAKQDEEKMQGLVEALKEWINPYSVYSDQEIAEQFKTWEGSLVLQTRQVLKDTGELE